MTIAENSSNGKCKTNYCSRIIIYIMLNIAVIILFFLFFHKSYTKWFTQISADEKIITQVSYHENNDAFALYHRTEIKFDIVNAISKEILCNLYIIAPQGISQIDPETFSPIYYPDYVELHKYYYDDEIYSLRVYWEDYNTK